jgi:hypothetical protein
MKLERFGLISFVVVLVLMFLAACGGDSDSVTGPAENTMQYVVQGRATLATNPTEGVPHVKIMVYKETEGGWTAPAETTSTDEEGYYTLRFRGNADYCPIVDRDVTTRGYSVVAADTTGRLFATTHFTARCGVSSQTWNVRMREPEDDGGECFFFCGPVDWG